MEEVLKKLRRRIVLATVAANEGHIPSSFCVLEILWVLYDRVLRVDPANPRRDDRDRFILSKGHASLALYAVLAEKGFFPSSDLERFATRNSPLGGHPDRLKVPGVEASTGSLGHGFPISVGMALALRRKGSPSRVFVLVGDGEANEGTIWEAALLGAHHGLDNLTLIVDHNHSTDPALSLGDLAAKLRSFDWDTQEVDGHDAETLFAALTRPAAGRPRAVIARTIKGYGSAKIQKEPGAWHHGAPKPADLAEILAELA
jgi:transketolase